MATVNRNGHLYLYRSVRRGRRVTSEYRGSGPLAILGARLDDEAREVRDEARRAEAAERETSAELERDLDELCRRARGLAAEALTATGYHQHARGQWRRRRGDRDRQD